ncbi:MAG: hypothetical protein KF832_16675 [Caldilineaceae bacterium]|nr:hypothetical protein [Caldilineaceae bacterium]
MKLWMDVMRTLEPVLADHERLLDAWSAGGVDGLVIGPLLFDQPKLFSGVRWETGKQPYATFDPDPAVYRRFGVTPPAAPPADPAKRRLLEQTLLAAKARGWSVWIFQASAGAGPGGSGHIFADEQTQAAICARMVDTLAHYPMVDGTIMDGPEWGYEIAPHHMNRRSYIFDDLPETVAPACQRLGYAYPTLVAAKDRFYAHLHRLDNRQLQRHAHGGLLGTFRLLGGDADLMAWFQFRVESLTAFFRQVRTALDREFGRTVKLGVGPRTAAFAPLCGYDFAQLAEFIDILLPKHYFFHRGFDGLIGTVYRYVETLTAWNPGLSDQAALAVVEALFGLALPGVQTRLACEEALTPAFFAQVVTQETTRALAVVDDPQRIVPWVDAGRAPHDGDPMSAGQLRQLLVAAQGAGLQRFLYHHQGNLTAGEWAVMSDLCGQPWQPLTSSYQPADEFVL